MNKSIFFTFVMLLLSFFKTQAVQQPFEELFIKGKTFNLVSNPSDINNYDEVVIAAYSIKTNGVYCMTSEDYINGNTRYDIYRETSNSLDGKNWNNESLIEIQIAENHNNLYSFKSTKGYLSGITIGKRENEISESSLWEYSTSNTDNTLVCSKTKSPLLFYDVAEMFVFSNQSYRPNAPYYLYKHTPQNKCSKPTFDIPEARYPHSINITISCQNANETISYSVYKNNGVEPWLTGSSPSNSCVLNLPGNDQTADTKYVIHARSHADGYIDNESIATYYICTEKYLAFTKVKDLSELYDNDLIIFVCPDLNSAMATDDISDQYHNRYGVPVDIKNDRIDILNPESSNVAMFYINTSNNDINAFTFNDYKYKANGNNGFLAISRNKEPDRVITTIPSANDQNYFVDWLIKIENDKAFITTNSDPSFSKTIACSPYSNNKIIYQLLPKSSMEQMKLSHINIYHPDKRLSSSPTINAIPKSTEIKAIHGGIRIKCNGSMLINIYSVSGNLIKTVRCQNDDFIDINPGFYIVATDTGENFKIIVR